MDPNKYNRLNLKGDSNSDSLEQTLSVMEVTTQENQNRCLRLKCNNKNHFSSVINVLFEDIACLLKFTNRNSGGQ